MDTAEEGNGISRTSSIQIAFRKAGATTAAERNKQLLQHWNRPKLKLQFFFDRLC